jgi:hypothetical protein
MPLANDRFANKTGDLNSPALDAFAVTPADGADLAQAVRGLYVGGAGAVTIVTSVGATVTFVGVPAGAIIPIRANRVNSTGTTATGIVGLV